MPSTTELPREFYAAVERDTVELKRCVMAMLPRMAGGAELGTWRSQGKILAVSWEREDTFPAFQFDDEKEPLPIMADLLNILRRDATRSDWRNLIWFASNNGWLGGLSPYECLSDATRVLHAAEMEIMPEEY